MRGELALKLLEGKKIDPDSLDELSGLIHEIEEVSAFSIAKEEVFMEEEMEAWAIVCNRVGVKMERKFRKASRKARSDGKLVNAAFVLSFLKTWFESLNRGREDALLDLELPSWMWCAEVYQKGPLVIKVWGAKSQKTLWGLWKGEGPSD